MQLRTLGVLRVEGASFNRPKPLLMLSYLILEGAKDSKHLSQLFFPQTTNPAQQLANTLSRLRKGLPGCIERDEASKKLKGQVSLDAILLLQTLEAGDLAKGLELYEGRFLEGLELDDVNLELEEWIYSTREFIAHRVRQALIRLGEQLLSKDPSQAAKASQYAEKAYLLAGAPEPSPEQFKRIYRLLVKGDSHLSAEVQQEAESFGIELDDLSADSLDQPSNLIYDPSQATNDEQRDFSATQLKVRHNLPERLSSFVGREKDVFNLKDLLLQGNRFITLLGSGGMGKTSLALQLLKECIKDNLEALNVNGFFFTSLETAKSREDILTAIASNVGFRLETQQDVLEQVKDYLKDKSYLLVLDNFEHLVSYSSVVSELLQACPSLRLLITSRERLTISTELVYPLEGLDFPQDTESPEQAKARAAVRLFLDRAKTANLRFSADETLGDVVKICNLVKGLPLGIELAAAWVKLISVQDIYVEIAKNLDFLEAHSKDRVTRHQSFRAVFEHSWSLLTAKDQEVLAKLSVFRGGFRREAAAEVTNATITNIMSLVDKSLIIVDETYRFDMHPLVLQYSREKFENLEQKEATLNRYANYFLSFAEARMAKDYTEQHLVWLNQLEEEMDNISAVFDWSISTQELDLGLRLANAHTSFWTLRGYFDEGSSYLKRLIALADLSKPNPVLAEALENLKTHAGQMMKLAEIYKFKQDKQRAGFLYKEALDIYKTINDAEGLGLAQKSIKTLAA